MTQRHTILLSICVLSTLCGTATTARAADAACKPVFDAMTKAAITPNHLFMTQTAAYNAAPESGETITTANKMYVNADGKWSTLPYNPQQQATEMREANKTGNVTCQYLRDEDVAGESTALYNTQDKQESGETITVQVWISKSTGLPVKQIMDMDVGGKRGKSHTDIRIDYSNVQAPAGAH